MASKKAKIQKTRAQRLHQRQIAEAKRLAMLKANDEEPEEDLELEEEDLIGDEEELDDEFEEEAEEELVMAAKKDEVLNKDMGPMNDMPSMDSAMPDMPMAAGPVSWDEYDAEQQATEQAEALSDVSYTARQLVSNILNHPMMDPEEQTKALQDVASGFGARAKDAMSMAMTEKSMSDDVEVLELEAMIAKDERSLSGAERVLDFINKKVLSYQGRKNLPESAFALPSKRKYPIHDKAHVRNALARAAQAMKRGGMAAADAKAAMPKIRAAAKRMGIGSMEKNRSALIVEKDAKGSWRWVGFPSNNFIDTDADILSEKAHKEYVDWINKNMDVAPLFIAAHIPGTAREHPVDFIGYENGFLIMSGELTEKEAAAIFRAQKLTDIGMSHGSMVLERDPYDERVITKYRMYEVSDLPLERAANPFTEFEVLAKEVGMNTKQYLATIIGEERAEKILAKMGQKQEALKEAGIENKEAKPTSAKKEAEKKPVQSAPTDFNVLWKMLEEKLDVEGLSMTIADIKKEIEKVPVLEQTIKAMSEDSEETLAEMISPPAAKVFSWSRPSEKSENILKDDKEDDKKLLKGVSAELGWLNQATNTQPLKQ